MTYQIPQQLEYKEKIMFGMTFRQLVYAFTFGFISIFFFRQAINEYVRMVFIAISLTAGAGFIFFDLEKHLRNYFEYLKFRRAKKGDPKLAKFIGIKDIKDDFIVDAKGKRISILKVTPLNFSLKPKNDQDAIIFSFQHFLNSLDFSTQILMSTESIDLKDYISSLEKRQTSKKFEDLLDSYKKYLHKVISSNKIMNRVFYVIIPEQSNIEIQTEICIDRIMSMNLKVERLKTAQLKSLLVKFFYGQGGEGALINALSPNTLENNPDHLNINGKLLRIVYAAGYPRMVEAGFLDKIVSSLADFNLCLHIKPYPIDRMLIDLNRELQKQQADLYSMQSKGIINPSLEIQHRDTRNTLEELQKGQERLFHVSLYICCKADSMKELDLLTKKVESELNSMMILPKTSILRMPQGFKATAPLGIDELGEYRNIMTYALSAFFPFTSQFLQVDNSGIWLGQNKNNIPIIKDIFKLPNPNGLVLAQSGGGKSYFCKLLITRYLLNGTKVMVIDPQGEYRNIVEQFKGQTINLSRESDTIINPLDLMGHDYAEKRLSLIDLMQVMLGKLTEPQKAFIDKAISEAYRRKGIVDDESTWGYQPPIMEDILDELKRLEKDAVQLEKPTVRSLINRVDMYVSGVFSFLNKHTKIKFDNQFVCFDIGNLPKQVKPAIMFLVLDYVYMKMKANLDKKILLIDESWSLLSRTEDASYIFEIVKTCRKFNMGLLLINQEVEGLLNSAAGKSVLANSAYTLLMRQKPAVIDNICQTFNLSPSERSHLLTASVGEGLLIMEDDHSKIKVLASPEEHQLITAKQSEIIKPEKKKSSENVSINLDLSKGLFKKKELNNEELRHLSRMGYEPSINKDPFTRRTEEYLIKKMPHESPAHAFTVFILRDFLIENGINAKTFLAGKPDLTFSINGKKIAIEVETGKVILNKNRILTKVSLLKDYDKWFFVVTNRNFVKKYRKYGKTIDPRGLASFMHRLVKKH